MPKTFFARRRTQKPVAFSGVAWYNSIRTILKCKGRSISGMGKRFICLLICLIILVGASAFPASAYSSDDPMTISSGIVAWKKADLGIDPGDLLINADYSELAGSASGDWYAIALSRLGANERVTGPTFRH